MPTAKLALGEGGALVISSKLFVCPSCGNQSLSIHRKTYEQSVIVFCESCCSSSLFEPSKEAYYDAAKVLEEFTAYTKLDKTVTRKKAILV